MRPFRFAALFALALSSSGALLHCSGDDSKASGGDAGLDALPDVSTADVPAASDVSDAGTPEALVDSGLTPYCQAFSTYALGCGYTLCDDGGSMFVSACDAFDNDVNSLTRRQAELMCLTQANCVTAARRNCDYEQYVQSTPTMAQQKLVADYCATCPTDAGNCALNAISYNADAGASSASAIFLAGWEYSDQVTTQLDTLCTGGALMQPEGGTCAAAFGSCVKVGLATITEWETYETCQ
jgi:hypothetical protein